MYFKKITAISLLILFPSIAHTQFSNPDTQRMWDQMRLMDLEDKVNRIEWDKFERELQKNRNTQFNNEKYTTPKAIILLQAKFWNLSPNEYARRDEIGNNECFHQYGFNEYSSYCWQSKVLNISIVDVQKRNRKSYVQCNKNLDTKKYEECHRNIVVLGK